MLLLLWRIDNEVDVTETDECAVGPCKNGGTCIDVANNFTCTCAAEYSGQACESKCTCLVEEWGNSVQ